MKFPAYLISIALFLAIIPGCKKDDDLVNNPPPVINEPEVITTIKLVFSDSSDASITRTAMFRDPDGDGGAAYDVFDTIRLNAGKTWNAEVFLLNETVLPADTISSEVRSETGEHLICYNPSNVHLGIEILDTDSKGLPLGLLSKWRTGAAGTGSIRIQLKHQPDAKNGSCEPGETDLEVTFPIIIDP